MFRIDTPVVARHARNDGTARGKQEPTRIPMCRETVCCWCRETRQGTRAHCSQHGAHLGLTSPHLSPPQQHQTERPRSKSSDESTVKWHAATHCQNKHSTNDKYGRLYESIYRAGSGRDGSKIHLNFKTRLVGVSVRRVSGRRADM